VNAAFRAQHNVPDGVSFCNGPPRLTFTKVNDQTIALAEKLHVTRPAMSHLLNGKADLSPEMAIRFEKGFGIPADTILRMQTAFDLADARAHADEIEVERLVA